jgi:hypothetical protein
MGLGARTFVVSVSASALLACGPPPPFADTGLEDAGGHDAGRDAPTRPDAGSSVLDVCATITSERWRVWADCDDWTDARYAAAASAAAHCPDAAALQAAIDDGAVTLDAAALRVCEVRWSTGSCANDAGSEVLDGWIDGAHGELGPSLAFCEGALTGHRLDGEACRYDFECVPESYCGPGTEECSGRCAPRAAIGEDCTQRACAAGAWCQINSTTHLCAAPLVRGLACDPMAYWSCNDGTSAGLDWYCDQIDATCQPPAELGDPCNTPSHPRCAPALTCATISDPTTCTAPGAAGNPCRPDERSCADGLFCSGGTLDAFDYRATSLGSCAAELDVGSPCTEHACRPELRCAIDGCAPRATLGAACRPERSDGLFDTVHSRDCEEGLLCAGGHCATQRFPGERCDDGASHCFASSCVAGVCVSRGGPMGAACDFDSECATGVCATTCANPFCSP